jgi:hypothetical protein
VHEVAAHHMAMSAATLSVEALMEEQHRALAHCLRPSDPCVRLIHMESCRELWDPAGAQAWPMSYGR